MAKTNTRKASESPDLSGMQSMISERSDYWAAKQGDNLVFGEYKGRFTFNFKGKPKGYHQFMLWADCHVTSKEGGEETIGPGTLINVDDVAALDPLKGLNDSKRHVVYLRYLEKEALSGGNTIWRVDLRSREFTQEELEKAPF